MNIFQEISISTYKKKRLVIFNVNNIVKGIIENIEMGNSNYYDNILLVIQDRELWEKNISWHPKVKDGFLEFIYGDPTDEALLKRINIETVDSAIILRDPNNGINADAPTALTAMYIEGKKDIHTVVELIESSNLQHLDSTGNIINEVVCLGDVSEKMIAQSAITHDVKSIFNTLLTFKKGKPEIFIEKIDKIYIDKNFKDVFLNYLDKDIKKTVIGYVKSEVNNDSKRSHYFMNPQKEDKLYRFKKDDQIVFVGIK